MTNPTASSIQTTAQTYIPCTICNNSFYNTSQFLKHVNDKHTRGEHPVIWSRLKLEKNKNNTLEQMELLNSLIFCSHCSSIFKVTGKTTDKSHYRNKEFHKCPVAKETGES